jgi:hypothetical protein
MQGVRQSAAPRNALGPNVGRGLVPPHPCRRIGRTPGAHPADNTHIPGTDRAKGAEGRL